jgi:hypothetical protein
MNCCGNSRLFTESGILICKNAQVVSDVCKQVAKVVPISICVRTACSYCCCDKVDDKVEEEVVQYLFQHD